MGPLSKDDVSTLKTIADYEPFRDAVVESTIPVETNVKAAVEANVLYRESLLLAALQIGRAHV